MPTLILLAGPNGAGKSTAAPGLLRDEVGPISFVNADTVAQGLSSYRPEDVAVQAGRIVIRRIQELAEDGQSFAVETTLAGRSYLNLVRRLQHSGYSFKLVFLWLPSEILAVSRVAARVQAGGHSIDELVVRRRYKQGIENFFRLYRPLSQHWKLYDNSHLKPKLVAAGEGNKLSVLSQPVLWHNLEAQWNQDRSI